jgi:Kelch motif
MKIATFFSRGLVIATLTAIGLCSCQKEGLSPSTFSGGLTKTDLGLSLPPVITWWDSVARIPYTSLPGDPPPIDEEYSIGFTINNKGFVLSGMLTIVKDEDEEFNVPDLWMYDPATHAWSKQAPYPGNYLDLVGEQLFVIGDNAYVIQDNAVWQYNQPSNLWTLKKAFPGIARSLGTAMAINGKGYFGTGITEQANQTYMKDWWQYDPVTDSWMEKNNFAGEARSDAGSFSIDGKGYVVLGYRNITSFKTVWQYDPTADSWTKKQNCPASASWAPATATIGGIDYGLMTDGSHLWQYNPSSDNWYDQGAVYGVSLTGPRLVPAGFVIGHSYLLANLSVVAYNWSK